MKFILASSSPRRKELLSLFQIPFDILPSHKEEIINPAWSPAEAVEQLARQKAEDIASQLMSTAGSNTYVIGSDTVVAKDNHIMGKPKSEEHAFTMLHQLQGQSHQVFTGLCVLRLGESATRIGHSVTTVNMAPMSETQIRRYIATGEPMDKAGAYGIQGFGSTFVEGIVGDYFTVVGLPLFLLGKFLNELGVSIF